MSCPGTAGAGCSTWSAKCLSILNATGNLTYGSSWPGLVDQNGNAMSVLSEATWGITYDTCKQYCNWDAISVV